MPRYKVLIDDNFHYLDPDHRIFHGEFQAAPEAIKACKRIVERSLREQYEPGMSAYELWTAYQLFGEDPFILPGDPEFSAWEYAKERAREITCDGKRS